MTVALEVRMARVVWEPVQARFCARLEQWVTPEVLRAYPADVLPDQPPRLLGRRCPQAELCNRIERPTCVWAGTQPDYDPLI